MQTPYRLPCICQHPDVTQNTQCWGSISASKKFDKVATWLFFSIRITIDIDIKTKTFLIYS